MIIYSEITLREIEEIASNLGFQAYNSTDHGIISRGKNKGRRRLTFVLRPTGNDRFRRINYTHYTESGRRKAWAICWHGHWNFMRNIYMVDSDALIQTSRIGNFKYHNLEEFLSKAYLSGLVNVGSQIYPVQLREQCDCEETGDYILRTN